MDNLNNQGLLCKSVFKGGKSVVSPTELTQKWLELINRLEKNKDINIAKPNDKLFPV